MTFEEKPWGRYDVLDEGKEFKVKRITVHPGHKLSLQFHHKRSEYWIVVSGYADVKVLEKSTKLISGEHIFIPLGAIHRMENKGSEDLVVIEVSIGDELSEDDIVRIEDDYGRE